MTFKFEPMGVMGNIIRVPRIIEHEVQRKNFRVKAFSKSKTLV